MQTSATITTVMCDELVNKLKALGWCDKEITRMIFGRRVCGYMQGITLEREGQEQYFQGPLFCVRGGDQIAIVCNS